MSIKAVLFCAQVLLIQTFSAQYIGPYDGYNYAAPWITAPMSNACPYPGPLAAAPMIASYANSLTPLASPITIPWANYGPASLAASNGGSFVTVSYSPLIPCGISVLSENVYEGALSVFGALPFLGTVSLEGALPTVGIGAVSYGCGNGDIRVTAQDLGITGFIDFVGPLGYEAGPVGPLAYGPELGINYTPGCGYGGTYY